MKPPVFLALFILLTSCASRKKTFPDPVVITPGPEKIEHNLLTDILNQYPQYFDTLLKNNEEWKIQIIYTQINRQADNTPVFTHYSLNADRTGYFYPASTVKLPVALLALQRLNELGIAGLDRNSTMITASEYRGQTAVFNDPTAKDGRPSIGQYIKKIFLVSDNDAYNRLYEFLGQDYINRCLHDKGYDSAQILHRLQISFSEDQNRATNPVTFYDSSSRRLYVKPLVKSEMDYQPRDQFMGRGYMVNKTLINEPFDFSAKNRILLSELHKMLASVIFPETFDTRRRFRLTDNDYQFLYRYMSMRPRESDFPSYDPETYNDAYSKLLMFGGTGKVPDSIRIFNKEGDAYGFLTDVAYIIDVNQNIEFFLSASISCNTDGIYNDDKYDYAKVGLPFMKHLGEVIYNYELTRTRIRKPNLSKFKLNYGR